MPYPFIHVIRCTHLLTELCREHVQSAKLIPALMVKKKAGLAYIALPTLRSLKAIYHLLNK